VKRSLRRRKRLAARDPQAFVPAQFSRGSGGQNGTRGRAESALYSLQRALPIRAIAALRRLC
jgi:hypothetical protein